MPKNICALCGQKFYVERSAKDRSVCDFCASLSPYGNADSVDNIRRYYHAMVQRNQMFNKTKTLKSVLGRSAILDENNKLFYIENKKAQIQTIYFFDDIISYHVEIVGQQEVTKKKGSVGRAVAGGLIAGPAGAIIGASTAKEETKLTGGTVVLKVNMMFFGVEKSLDIVYPPTGFEKFLDYCISLHSIKEREAIQNQKPVVPIAVNEPVSVAEELMKFKQLLDAGAITQHEFEEQKRKLLNL